MPFQLPALQEIGDTSSVKLNEIIYCINKL